MGISLPLNFCCGQRQGYTFSAFRISASKYPMGINPKSKDVKEFQLIVRRHSDPPKIMHGRKVLKLQNNFSKENIRHSYALFNQNIKSLMLGTFSEYLQ